MFFVDWGRQRISVCGATRGKNDLAHSAVAERIYRRQPLRNIVVEVHLGVFHGFPNISERRKVYARANALFPNDPQDQFAIAYIPFAKRNRSWNRIAVSARQIIEDGDAFATIEERINRH
jgi:hypothetical protein